MEIVQPVKKSTAIILAVFFSFWSWLYTYKRDSLKFWLAFLMFFILLVPIFLLWNTEPTPAQISYPYGEFGLHSPGPGADYGYASIGAGIIFSLYYLSVWLFTVLFAIARNQSENNNAGSKNNITAILLSVIFGPLAWIYNYDRDKWKLWLSIVVFIAGIIFVPRMAHAFIFSSIKEISHPGYVDLTWSFSHRLNNFLFNNLWQYSEYYQLKNIKPVSFWVPGLLWAFPVAENIVRLLHSGKGEPRVVLSEKAL
jgi:hypothetical protein